LYRFEDERLDAFQLANRISYLIWPSAPDEELLAVAAAGGLDDPATLRAQVRRLFDSPQSIDGAENFVGQWFGPFSKNHRAQLASKVPAVSAGIAPDTLHADLRSEFRASLGEFIQHNAPVSALLTSTSTFVSPSGSLLYGLPPVSRLTRVQFQDNAIRQGLLTTPYIIAGITNTSGTSPMQFGHFLVSNVACIPVATPDPNLVNNTPIPDNPSFTLRENFEGVTAQPVCIGCHASMNPAGFAFHGFDPLGRFASADPQGRFLDLKGTMRLLSHGPITFNGPTDFSRLVARTDDFAACFSKRLLEYAYGRTFAEASDTETFYGLVSLVQQKAPYRDIVEAFVVSDHFRTTPRSKP
jgi:hypothetical protein